MAIRGTGSRARFAGVLAFTAFGAAWTAGVPGLPASALAAEVEIVAAMMRPAPGAMSPATRALFNAIKSHDLRAVKTSIKDGADVLATSDEGQTSLDLALAQGYFDIARYLMIVQTEKRTALTKRLAELDAEREEAESPAPLTQVAGATPKVSVPLPPPLPDVEPGPTPPPAPAAAAPVAQQPAQAEQMQAEPKLAEPAPVTVSAPKPPAPEKTDMQPAAETADVPADKPADETGTSAEHLVKETAPAVGEAEGEAGQVATTTPDPAVEASTETTPQRVDEKPQTPSPEKQAAPEPAPMPKRYHVIRRGETLTGIAVRYGVSPQELMALNNIDRADHILIGNRMFLPDSARNIPEEPLPPPAPPAPAPQVASATPAPEPVPEMRLVAAAPEAPAPPDPTVAAQNQPSVAPAPPQPQPEMITAQEPPKPAEQVATAADKPAIKVVETNIAPEPPSAAEPEMVTAPPPPDTTEAPPAKESAEESPGLLGFLSNLFGGGSNEQASEEPAELGSTAEASAKPEAESETESTSTPEAKPEPEPEATPAAETAPAETAMVEAPPPPPAPPTPQVAAPPPPKAPTPPPITTSRPASPLPAAAPAEPPEAPLVEQDVAVQQLPPALPREGAPAPAPPLPPLEVEKPAPEEKVATPASKIEPEEKPKEEPGFLTAMSKGFGKLFSGKNEEADEEADKEPAQAKDSKDEFVVAKAPEDERIELRKDGTVSVAVQEIESPLKPPDPTAPVEQAAMPPAVQSKVVPPVAARTLNPFDPKNAPVGSTLPIVDPIAGDHPELGSVPIPKTLPRIEISDANRIEMPAPREVVPITSREKPAPAPRIRLRPVPKTNFDHEPTTIDNLMTFLLPDNEEISAKREIIGKREKTASLSPPPVTNVRKPLVGVDLKIGDLYPGIEKAPIKDGDREACVHRPGKSEEFCIVPVDWPEAIAPAFTVNTILYQGTRAIVRFDNDKATHIHALFNASDYRAVIQYLLDKYGQETDVWQRTIAPFNKPREPNPTRIWRSIDPETKIMTVLEVRRYDDTRSTFPDVRHGVVRLYSGDAKKLFPTLSTLDIMTIDWAARADIPSPDGLADDEPALANTLPAQR